MTIRHALLLATLLAAAGGPAVVADEPAEQQKQDLEAFKKYLADKHPGKKWSAGPTALDSKEVRQAYPGKRYYFVHTSPPLPPGAPLKELIERHRERMIDYQKNFISVTVAITGKDTIKPIGRTPADLGDGLMAVQTENDAKTAAAAVLSVMSDGRGGPGVVTAAEVKMGPEKNGWLCVAEKRFAFQGTVKFAASGKLEQASKFSTAPLPP